MAKLVGTAGPVAGKEFPVSDGIILGRAFDANVRIDDLSVSRHHAKITQTARGFVLNDLGSSNGTMLNGAWVHAPTPLRDGDNIQICQAMFTFREREGVKGAPDHATTVVLRDVGIQEQNDIISTVDIRQILTGPSASEVADPPALYDAHQRLKLVVEVSNAIQTEFDLDRLLNGIMERLFRIFPYADHGFIMLKESEESDDLVAKVVRVRGSQEARGEIAFSRRIAEEVMKRRVGVLSANALVDGRFAQAASVVNFRIRSIMCVPLVARESFLGLISIHTQRPDARFTTQDLELLTALANQAAFAIANATLHQRLIRQQRIERDLLLAQQVQHSFLPDKVPQVPGMTFCASYRVAMEVGGDFYDFIHSAPSRLGVVVGDVAGKGVPAALLMARITSDVRFFALAEPQPCDILHRVNSSLTERPAGDAFVTMLYVEIEPQTRRVRIANAGHPPAVLRRVAEGEVRELGAGVGFPIGVMPGAEYEQEEFVLTPGDAVAMFSDGVTEAMNSRGETFGTERVRAAVAHGPSHPEAVLERLLADIKKHVGETPQSDDLTLVCFGLS